MHPLNTLVWNASYEMMIFFQILLKEAQAETWGSHWAFHHLFWRCPVPYCCCCLNPHRDAPRLKRYIEAISDLLEELEFRDVQTFWPNSGMQPQLLAKWFLSEDFFAPRVCQKMLFFFSERLTWSVTGTRRWLSIYVWLAFSIGWWFEIFSNGKWLEITISIHLLKLSLVWSSRSKSTVRSEFRDEVKYPKPWFGRYFPSGLMDGCWE